jgi:hypothetical protein
MPKKVLKMLGGRGGIFFGFSWDTFLPWVLFNYQEVPIDPDGFSPFELLFGHNVRGPLSLIKSVWTDKQILTDKKQNVIDFVLGLRSKPAETCELAVCAPNEARQQS